MRNRWQYILLALALAVFSWFQVTGREKVDTWLPVSLEMANSPEGLIIRSGMVSKVEVRVRGPKGLVRSLLEQKLAYSIDAANLTVGDNLIEFDAKKLPLSGAFEVVEFKPSRVILDVDRVDERQLPVDVSYAGAIDPYYDLEYIKTTPDVVSVRGPESVLRTMNSIPLVVSDEFGENPPAKWHKEAALVTPEGVEPTPGVVTVEMSILPKTKEIWVKVPLEVEAPDTLLVRPRQDFVRLYIKGPLYLFRNNDFRNDIHAVLRVPRNAPPELNDQPFDVLLPGDVTLERKNPEVVSATVAPR